jgi:hypothetical protein
MIAYSDSYIQAVACFRKPPDTVGELRSVENCASCMASLKAEGLESSLQKNGR